VATEVIKVQGMSCNHCKSAVEGAVKSLPGISEAEVDLKAAQLKVSYDEAKLSRQQIDAAVEKAGYSVSR
jgi:copper chaperone